MLRQFNVRSILGLIMLLFLLLACGLTNLQTGEEPEPSAANVLEVDLEATGTKLAADFYATQTAAAPVEAPTDAPEPGAKPTDTPEPGPTPSDTPEPTPTDTPPPTDTPLPTETPLADVVVNSTSINMRAGPGTHYDTTGTVRQGETASVQGQAYDCAWLLVRLDDGQTGWITGGSEYVTLNLTCDDIPPAEIPPSPTPAATAVPPPPPPPPTPSQPTVTVYVENNTGGTLTLDLNGPAVYHFTIQTGRHPIQVVPGQYNYTGYGCGGASKSGIITMEEGDEWEWWCA